jgi:hypothetical protein
VIAGNGPEPILILISSHWQRKSEANGAEIAATATSVSATESSSIP